MEKLKRVVGIAFVEDGKLLIVKSQRSNKTNSWTLVGGGIEASGILAGFVYSNISKITDCYSNIMLQ